MHILYIALFVLLGILVQFIIHAVLEVLVIAALVTNFERFNLGLTWSQWLLVHHIGSLVLLLGGAGIG